MASGGGEHHLLSTEIVNRGIESTGPNAGSPTFSIRVRRRLPDFVQSASMQTPLLSLEPLYKEGAPPAFKELGLSYETLCQRAIEELLAYYCTQLTLLSALMDASICAYDLDWGSSSDHLYQFRDSCVSSAAGGRKSAHGADAGGKQGRKGSRR